MAISAYTSEGRLKKNPLLGTSLKSDYKQRKQKRAFGSLYDEASQGAATGSTQADLTNRLRSRNDTASAINVNRLRDLSNQNASMGVNRNDLRDRAQERGFANYEKGYGGLDSATSSKYGDEWSARSGGAIQTDQNFDRERVETYQQRRNRGAGNSMRKQRWEDAGGVKLTGNKATGGRLDFGGTSAAQVRKQIEGGGGFDASAFGGSGLGGYKIASGKSGKRFDQMGAYGQQEIMSGLGMGQTGSWNSDQRVRKNFAKWASGLNAHNKKAYAMDKYGEDFGADKKRAYNQRVRTGEDLYDRQQRRIQQEAPKIVQRMQERSDLYNMFAGG